jgi:hypothetical protein
MAITVVAWPGTSAGEANSYDTVANVNSYMLGRLGADAWTDAATDLRNQAVVSATRMIDRQSWQGTRSEDFPYSPLAWPRDGVVDRYGNDVDGDTLPDDFVVGFYELVLALLEDEAVQDVPAGGSNTKRVKAGQVEVEFFRPTLGVLGRFSQIVQELLGQYLSGARGGSGGIISGDDRLSYFDVIESDDPDVAVDNTFGVGDVIP